jgi:hypothetical protein
MSYSCTIPRISSKSSNASPVSGEESEYPVVVNQFIKLKPAKYTTNLLKFLEVLSK